MNADNATTDAARPPPPGDRPALLRAGLLAALGLVGAAAATALLVRGLWPPALVYGLATALAAYGLISDEQLVDEAIILLTTAMFVLLAIMLGLWLVVHFHWAAQDAALTTAADLPQMVINGQAYQPELLYAPVAPQGEPDGRALTLTLSPLTAAAAAPANVIAQLTPPPGLRFSTSGGAPISALTLPVGAAAGPVVRRIWLVNDGTTGGARAARELVVRFPAASAGGELRAPVIIEGRWGFRLRRFVMSTVDPNGPLIFLGLLVAPAAAALARRWTEERRAREERRRRDAFQRARDGFRTSFLAEDLATADKELAALRAIRYPSGEVEREAAAEIELADALLKFARGQAMTDGKHQTALTMMNARWPEGFAAAFVMAHAIRPNWVNLDHQTFSSVSALYSEARLLLQYPAIVGQPDLEDRLALALAEGVSLPPYQGREWPPRPACGPRRAGDPLLGDDAADQRELCFLFDGGFYGHHPLFHKRLWRRAGSHLVSGPPGSGRTAFAAMLTIWSNERDLTVALDGRSLAEFRLGPARLLTRFALRHPTHLEWLGRARRRLLAGLMITALGSPAAVAAAIEDTEGRLAGLPDLAGEERRRQRQRAGQHLQLLLRELPQAAPPPSPSGVLDSDIRACMTAFGFNRAVFVVDLPPAARPARALRRAVYERLRAWDDAGADFVIFVPDAAAGELAAPPHGFSVHRLTWSRDDLLQLIQTRYQQADGLKPLSERFESSGDLTTLIEQSKLDSGKESQEDKDNYNPRLFFHLWREADAAARADKEQLITPAHIAQAVGKVKGTDV